jgi:iron(III) transport system ATP-binding protein
MDQGIIQQVGTPMDLFDFPVNRFVAQFIGSINLFPGSISREGNQIKFISPALGSVVLPKGLELLESKMELAFRPHAVSFTGDHHATDRLGLRGIIEDVEFLGEVLRYDIRTGDALIRADIAHARGVAPLRNGTAIEFSVPSSELRLVAA